MVMEIIQVRDLRKSYAGRPVLHGIDLSIHQGEVFGILGPNGAGKTTTVEIIGGLRTRDAGEVSVAGLDPASESRQLRRLLGIQLQEARQPAKITVREAINLFRTFYRNPVRAEELMDRFGLAEQANTRFENLSGGQQQRLSVALALVGRPRIAILDELTTGLDPAARREIWAYLADLTADGVTIVLVTHSMEGSATVRPGGDHRRRTRHRPRQPRPPWPAGQHPGHLLDRDANRLAEARLCPR